VTIRGFTNRAVDEVVPAERIQELLAEEDEARLDYEAGRSAERRALIESSSPNRYDTPRGMWAAQNAVAEGEAQEDGEEEDEVHDPAADIVEDDDTRYGAPATEDEPEPHEPDTELEGEPDLDVLRGHARRMQRVLAWHQNLLDMAQSRGEFDEIDRIERDIDYVEGLLMNLPRP